MDDASRRSMYLWFLGGFVAPPPLWLLACWYTGLWNTSEFVAVVLSPLLAVYVVGYIIFAVFLFRRKLVQIDTYLTSPTPDLLTTARKSVNSIRIMFLLLVVTYCTIGPNTGLLGKEFIDTKEYLLSWLFGVAMITVYTVPFYAMLLSTLEAAVTDIPMDETKTSMNIAKRFYIILATPSVFAIIATSLFIYAVQYKNPGVLMDAYLHKIVVFGVTTTMALLLSMIIFTRQVSRQCNRIRMLATAMANGDLRERIDIEERTEIGLVAQALNRIAEKMELSIGHVADVSRHLAKGSSQQAAAIEETSASLEEMAAMTRQNAADAGKMDSIMKEESLQVAEASQVINKLTTSMVEISNASEETSKIVKTIDEISFQTNLLALNAAVEAARAGEAGAGFAVVAEEVRNLAMRAAEAAGSTSNLIEDTVKKINEGSGFVSKTNDAFTKVVDSSSQVAELVGKIAESSSEQANGIEQVNKATAEMDAVIQQNAAEAEALTNAIAVFTTSNRTDRSSHSATGRLDERKGKGVPLIAGPEDIS